MSYADIAKRIAALKSAQVVGEVGPKDSRLPFYCVQRGRGRKVLLFGAVHGDEPAGTEAIIEFLEKDASQYLRHFEFTVFPCVNPWGFEHYERYNAVGLNINREFKKHSPSEEVRLVQSCLEGRYAAAIDLHEVMKELKEQSLPGEPDGANPEEFFLWETCENRSMRLSRKIIRNVKAAGYPICKWPTIFGDKNNRGVIWYPEDCGASCYADGTTSDSFLVQQGYTDHAFTIETVREWPMKDRVNINLITIRTILENKLRNS